MRSNLMYHDILSCKYGINAVREFKTMIVRPAALRVPGSLYGPEGRSAAEMAVPNKALKDTYRKSHQCLTQDEWLRSQHGKPNKDGVHQLSLTPTLFWYDNTHIVNTTHYRDFIFAPHYKMVARGGFVEDKLSPCLVRSAERLGLRAGHAKFGCYLLDDHSGAVFTGHLDGGSYGSGHLHYDNGKHATDAARNG